MDTGRKLRHVQSKIRRVYYINTRIINNLWIPSIEIRRENDFTDIIDESEFDQLSNDDIQKLFDVIKTRPPSVRRSCALAVLLRCMRRKVVIMIIKDFQLAIENQVTRVGIAAPDLSFAMIGHLPIFKLIKKPEHGVVYCTKKNEKKFMRFIEITAFCDGTLREIRRGIRSRLQREDTLPSLDRMPFEERTDLLEGIDLINQRLALRESARRFETCLKVRKKL